MPLLAVKVIVITALVGVAVGTALYENHPPFRNWVDDRFDEFKQHTQPMRAGSGYASDDEEKNRDARVWELGQSSRGRGANSDDEEDDEEEADNEKSAQSKRAQRDMRSSDSFQDAQDRASQPALATGHDASQTASTLRQRTVGQAGFEAGHGFANPFNDDNSVLFDRDEDSSTVADVDEMTGQAHEAPERPPTPPPRPWLSRPSLSPRPETSMSDLSFASIPSREDQQDAPAVALADAVSLVEPCMVKGAASADALVETSPLVSPAVVEDEIEERWAESTISNTDQSSITSEPSLIDWEDTMSASGVADYDAALPAENRLRLVGDGVLTATSDLPGSPMTPRAGPIQIHDDAFSTGSWDSLDSNESFGPAN